MNSRRVSVRDIDCMVVVIKEHLLQQGIKFVVDSENNQQPLGVIDGVIVLLAFQDRDLVCGGLPQAEQKPAAMKHNHFFSFGSCFGWQ